MPEIYRANNEEKSWEHEVQSWFWERSYHAENQSQVIDVDRPHQKCENKREANGVISLIITIIDHIDRVV